MPPRQPMYQQIADDLIRQIDSGQLAPGSQLPTELELRSKHGNASRNTIRDAIKVLEEKHLVEKKPGRGTFVTVKIEPFITDLSPQTGDGGEEGQTYPEMVKKDNNRVGRAGKIMVGVLNCPPDVADLLGISPGAEVISRSQERYIDDILWSEQTSYYPRKREGDWESINADRLLSAENIPEGTTRYLAELGLRQARFKDLIMARTAKDDEPKRFQVPPNAAMFLIYRTSFTRNDTAIRVTVTLYPADRNQFTYEYDNLPDLLSG